MLPVYVHRWRDDPIITPILPVNLAGRSFKATECGVTRAGFSHGRVFAWPGFRMAEFSHGRVFAWPSFRMDGHKMVTTQSIRGDMDHDGTGVRTQNNGGFPDDAARSETDQYGLNGISRPPRSTTPAARRRERRSRFRRASRVCRSSPSRAVPSPMVLDVNRPVDKGSGALRVRVW